jgi:hypothetical protein
MPTFVIGYDIHPTEGETYDKLIEAIKAYGTWWHHLDCIWLIVTDDLCNDVADNLYRHMKSGDKLIVMATCGVWASCGLDTEQNWLTECV